MPDYTSDEFKYQYVKDTPSDIDDVSREVNDFNPRVQLKKLFHEENADSGEESSDSYDSDDEMDKVITCTVQACTVQDNDKDDEAPGEDSDKNDAVENLFVATRSGRVAGNWRLSTYIGI
ncbi:Hypothetical predicted protein [Paramuricea clavata]|uniref:Uncharacterized protein n=1 Tax=Paramuricea clavata TaxID=317549 RepID=A0A7D9KBH0_PARCT|nr:Hypothetical predicted protein [Paramuricea clavata]